jgi:hypothetical protein
MAEARTNEEFRRLRRWRALLERDHVGCREAFEELLGAGCVEETLVGWLINLERSNGLTKRSRGELAALAKQIDKWARAIERVQQADVVGIVDGMNVRLQMSCGKCNHAWVEWTSLSSLLRQSAATLAKQVPVIPPSRNVAESRALMWLDEYVREATGGKLTRRVEEAVNTLATAVLGRTKKVAVRQRAHRLRKPARTRSK